MTEEQLAYITKLSGIVTSFSNVLTNEGNATAPLIDETTVARMNNVIDGILEEIQGTMNEA